MAMVRNCYRFLREAIAQGDFASRGVEIDPDDIFVSDGAKCDLGNFQELFGRGNVIAVTDPVYPVYVDSNVMGGRAGTFDGNGSWSGIVYLPCSAENGFVPSPSEAARRHLPVPAEQSHRHGPEPPRAAALG
ncbi:MAG: hypothetical protein ACLSHC_15415 [Bilophila wadsworthia]